MGEKLLLHFTIDAPNKELHTRVQHTYTQLLYLAKNYGAIKKENQVLLKKNLIFRMPTLTAISRKLVVVWKSIK